MKSWIDQSKLQMFKLRLEKSMLGTGGKLYSISSANARIMGMESLHDKCRLRN